MKLMALQETHVYLNDAGGVSIRQVGWPDDDQLVALNGDQVELVMLELQRLLAENKFSMEIQEDES
jgi:hypothetical protein